VPSIVEAMMLAASAFRCSTVGFCVNALTESLDKLCDRLTVYVPVTVQPAPGHAVICVLSRIVAPTFGLKINSKSVRKVPETPVGGIAEGLAFSPDGRFLYVGIFIEVTVVPYSSAAMRAFEGGNFSLPGHPASMRGRAR